MIRTLPTLTILGLSVFSVGLFSLGQGCAPDSSVGSDSVPKAGSSSAAGAPPAGGSPAASEGGSPAAPSGGSGDDTAGSSAGGSSPGGSSSGGSGNAAAGKGGGTASAGSGSSQAGAGMAGPGGASLCPVAGSTICDGFEGSAPGTATSPFTTAVTAPDTVVVDTTKFYRGSKSVKFSGKAQAFLLASKIFTGTTKATNNELWGRYFFFSNMAAGSAPAGHVVFGALADAANSGDQFHFAGGSRAKLQAEIRLANSDRYTDSATAPAATDPAYPVVGDGWQCWEFHVTADDSFEFFINGVEETTMKIVKGKASKSGATFSPMPIFGGLYLGWQAFGGTAVVSGWIDEVAVGPNRIPCGS